MSWVEQAAGADGFAGELQRKHGLTQLSLIGNGGMGQVFRAYDQNLERWVAVKVIRPEAVSTGDGYRRFAAEMRTLAGIRHAAVMNIHYASQVENTAYFVMDYEPGGDLEDALAEHRASGTHYTAAEVGTVLRPVADALDHLHARTPPVVHRDLKPANILLPVDPATTSVLTDFGISIVGDETRVTSTGLVIGTQKYMAPEIYTVASTYGAHEVDYNAATDRYALALIALEMLTLTAFRDTMSQSAWQGNRRLPELSAQNLSPDDVRDPAAVSRITAVLRTALDNDPAQRFASSTAFLDALVAATRGPGRDTTAQTRAVPVGWGPQQPPTQSPHPRQPRKRTRRRIAVLTTVVLLAAATGLLGVLGYRQVLHPAWDSQDATIVDAFPGLLPERQNQDGWRGMNCEGKTPQGEESARVVCADSGMTMAVVDFGGEDTRASYVPDSGTEFLRHDGGMIRTSLSGDSLMVFPEDGYRTRFAMLMNGTTVEQADSAGSVVGNIPVY
ncbi:MAG: serine/threonine-protein kinase [Mycobacteriaceae bacterium]|uniref:serine/threonine-protein kinase n=1 Tax=Corynebacterium sp. TaxID=1720 RepID=UPI003F9960D3